MYTIDYKYSQPRHWFLVGKKTTNPQEILWGQGRKPQTLKVPFCGGGTKPTNPQGALDGGAIKERCKAKCVFCKRWEEFTKD